MSSRFAGGFAAIAALAGVVLAPGVANAASLTPVSNWSPGGVPSYISMYEYVPDQLAASPPVVIAAHYCGGSAQAMYNAASGIVAAANKYGFIMVFPQTTNPASAAKCWDVGSTASLTHDGGGDTQAIAQMVQYEVANHGGNADRVYAMGVSSGAMLTEALMAVYPDVFKAGAEFSGVPAGCWAIGWSAAGNWSSTCSTGNAIKTAQQWGDLVRAMYPGYSGQRPRVQLWHGTADTTININNQTEAIKEWTNVLGLTTDPTSTTMASGFTIQKWQDGCGLTLLDAHTQANGGHTTPIDANAVISFFGLDTTGPDPQQPCSVSPGSGGTNGSGGSNNGSGGSSAASGGSTGDNESAGMGSVSAGNGGEEQAGAGTIAEGGRSAAAGASGVGEAGAPMASAGAPVVDDSGGTLSFGGAESFGGMSSAQGGARATENGGTVSVEPALPQAKTTNFFGCSVATPGSANSRGLVLLFGIVGLAFARRRREITARR